MPNPLSNVMEKLRLPSKARYSLARVQQELIGLAQDYWRDGGQDAQARTPEKHKNHKVAQGKGITLTAEDEDEDLWHALPGEISEKMWGSLYVTPGDEEITDRLIMPLGINKDMNVLDLSAGLGGRLCKTSEEFGVYISGMEPDPDIAARGMALAKLAGRGKHVVITHYDPMTLSSTRTFDCVIARETIYRVSDKAKFIKLISGCCKRKAQISFTDYIVDPEVKDQPAIAAWKAYEQGANPPSLVEMAEMWAKNGFTLRVHDDQTDYYKKEIVKGMGRLAKFLTSDLKLSPLTKKALDKRVSTWAHRMAALDAGMKFYRFYGLR